MNDVEAVASTLSFEDLLQAVNESSRGRWFLDEYQKRVRKADNGDILSAIARIEARISQLPAPASSSEMDRMKAAVNNARADIAKLSPAKTLSDEGRLFASLAELARKTLPSEKATADLAPGIVKALQLVDELDTTLNGSSSGDKYFKQDTALFEPVAVAAAPKPVLVAVTPEPQPEPQPQPEPVAAPKPEPVVAAKPAVKVAPSVEIPAQGAKLVIIKSGQSSASAPAEQAAPTPVAMPVAMQEATPTPAPIAAAKAPEAALPIDKIDNPRIVIIRRKPEDMTEVPLADAVKTETAA